IYTNATIAVSERIYDIMKNVFQPKYFQLPVMSEGFKYEVSDFIKTIHPDYLKGDMVSHIKPTLDQLTREYAMTGMKRMVIMEAFDKDIDDFALLASCSHSVMTVGSFGFWSGFLAGGSVVYAHVPALQLLVDPINLGPVGFQNWHPINMDSEIPES
ncbi:unnamed protein product, partial [Meganyctiphanes norvegica]